MDCPRGGYPALDAEGDKIYENTHFPVAGDAWTQLLRESEARLESSARAVAEARQRLAELTQRLAGEAEIHARVIANRREWIDGVITEVRAGMLDAGLAEMP